MLLSRLMVFNAKVIHRIFITDRLEAIVSIRAVNHNRRWTYRSYLLIDQKCAILAL